MRDLYGTLFRLYKIEQISKKYGEKPCPILDTLVSGSPVAVPDKIFGLTLFLDFIDRCHSLPSLPLPPAAVGSLPHYPGRETGRRRDPCPCE